MTAALLALYLLGAAGALAFLGIQRPRSWARVEFVNAVGWVVVAGVVFLRGAILIFLGGQPPRHGPWGNALSVGLLALVDVLVVLRLVSFLRWTRNRARHRRPPG